MDAQVAIDWAWASKFDIECRVVALRELAPRLLEYIGASRFEDLKKSIDFKIKAKAIEEATVALRVRRAASVNRDDGSPRFRDLTIRSKRDNDTMTEAVKLWDSAHFYFYGWVSEEDCLEEFILVEINDRLRELFDREHDRRNYDRFGKPDGTWFRAIAATRLRDEGLLVSEDFTAPGEVEFDQAAALAPWYSLRGVEAGVHSETLWRRALDETLVEAEREAAREAIRRRHDVLYEESIGARPAPNQSVLDSFDRLREKR